MLYEEPNMIIKIKPEYLHCYYCVLKHYVYRIMFVILKTNYKASMNYSGKDGIKIRISEVSIKSVVLKFVCLFDGI